MAKVKVKLTQSRAGVGFADSVGDMVWVSLLEAGRMYRAGQINKPSAANLKKIAAAEAEAATERAAPAAEG